MKEDTNRPQSLESYKEEVYNYLTKQLGASIETAKELMKAYDNIFDEYLENKLSVSAVATAMWYGF